MKSPLVYENKMAGVLKLITNVVIFISDAPEMSSTSNTCHHTKQGEDITLHCIAESLPSPTIKWY